MKNEWPKKKLGDVILEIKDGGTPSRTRPEYFGGDIYWCVVRDIKPQIYDTAEKLTKEGLSNSSAKVWPIDSVIISLGATIGQIGIAKVPTATKQGLSGIVVDRQQLIPEFLAYGLHEQKEHIQSLATGTTIKEIRPTKLKETISVIVPPLLEQQRIVGVLDKAFVNLATAQAHAEKNLQNACKLLESHVQSVFTQRDKGWMKKPLVDVCELFFDSAHRTPKYEDVGIPALRPRDVVNGNLNLAEALRVSEAEYEIQSKRYKPRPGDIVYSRELSLGWAAVLPESPRVCLSQGMCVFRASSNLIPAFLTYVLNSSIGREQAIRAAVGAAHPHINLGEIKSYSIPIPPLPEQNQILARLDVLTMEAKRLQSLYQQKHSALAALKRSLLRQAFSGEL